MEDGRKIRKGGINEKEEKERKGDEGKGERRCSEKLFMKQKSALKTAALDGLSYACSVRGLSCASSV